VCRWVFLSIQTGKTEEGWRGQGRGVSDREEGGREARRDRGATHTGTRERRNIYSEVENLRTHVRHDAVRVALTGLPGILMRCPSLICRHRERERERERERLRETQRERERERLRETQRERSKVNPGSPMGQPWVPVFWGATVGSRTKIVNRGSPRPVFSFACAGQPDQIVNL
jgi:hypothetical protein